MDRNALPLRYSLYLDGLRFAAALMVFLSHVGHYPFVPKPPAETSLSVLQLYGAPAVTIFFVLSGYVIAYVVATRERDARSYTISRVSRLYSVVVPALLLTLLFDTLGAAIDPGLYAEAIVSPDPITARGYVASFFLVNEFQVFQFGGIGPGSNGPWWSLSFEAAYYLLAGLVLFARPRIALLVGLVFLLCAGRTIAALLPLWMLGFILYHRREALARRLPLPWLMWLGSIAAILSLPHLLPNGPGMNFGLLFPWARAELNRNLTQDYAVAAAVALHLIAAYRLFGAGRKAPVESGEPGRTVAIVRFLGATTFPLYAMHRPAMFLLAALNPWPSNSAAGIAFVAVPIALGVMLVTPVCDWLKVVLRQQLKRLWPARTTVAMAAGA